MKLEKPKNPEYAATVVALPAKIDLPGMDNVEAVRIHGFQVIVSKNSAPGTLGVFFPAETQLSDEFVKNNNLYRHSDLNLDKTQKGFFEDNRRVKAVKFRGHRSDGFWIPLSALAFTTFGILQEDDWGLREGDTFDNFNGLEICRKYVPKGRGQKSATGTTQVSQKRVSEKMFPQHKDTSNYFRVSDTVKSDDLVVITQKLHGTSVRFGKVLAKRQLKWYERALMKLGVQVRTQEYTLVAGTRRVIKDPDRIQNSFYEEDIYTQAAMRHGENLPDGYVLYGELIGWAGNSEIQKGYTYEIPQGQFQFYAYRVTMMNPQGVQQDLSWPAVKEFCTAYGIKHVPEFRSGYVRDVSSYYRVTLPVFVDRHMDINFSQKFFDRSQAVPLPKDKVDEGVVIRIEGLEPRFLKAKSPKFLQHETKMLDKGEVDMESMNLYEVSL